MMTYGGKMFKKNHLILILFSLATIIYMGCTIVDDRPKEVPPPPLPPPQQPIPVTPAPEPKSFLTESPWELVSIENKDIEDYFIPLQGDYVDTESEVAQNDFVFFTNGSWYLTLHFKITAKLKDESGLAYLTEVTLAGRGQYTESNTKLILVLEEMDADLKPPKFWESAGVSEESFAEAITSGRVYGKVENWTMDRRGNTLTLTSADGKITQVLRKQ